MNGQKYLKSMKKAVNQIENQGEIDTNVLNLLNNTFWRKIRPNIGPSISGINVIETNRFFSAERGGQSDSVEV